MKNVRGVKRRYLQKRGLSIVISLIVLIITFFNSGVQVKADETVYLPEMIFTNGVVSDVSIFSGREVVYGTSLRSNPSNPYANTWMVLDTKTNTGETGLFMLYSGNGMGDDAGYYETDPWGQSFYRYQVYFGYGDDYEQELKSYLSCYLASNFSECEQENLISTYKSDNPFRTDVDEKSTLCVSNPKAIDGEKIFLLSAEEASIFLDEANPFYDKWPVSTTGLGSYSRSVTDDGWLVSIGKQGFSTGYGEGVRPAINLSLDNVLLITRIDAKERPWAGSKRTIGESAFSTGRMSSNLGDYVKLTLYETTRGEFKAETKTVDGNILTVKYSNAIVGDNEYISSIIVGSDGKVKWYGKMYEVDKPSGEFTIDLSAAIDSSYSEYRLTDSDTIYVFNEKAYDGNQTDYSSHFIKISLTSDPGEDSVPTQDSEPEPQPGPTPNPEPTPEPLPDPQPDSKPVVIPPLFSDYMTLVDNSPKIDQLNNNGVWQKVIPKVEGIIQGPLARMAWAQQLKDKWGDTYCLFTNGSLVYNRKKGKITVKVGENRDNHSYSIRFLDKNGRLETYSDIDDNPNTVTVDIDTTGYAFMLIDDTQKAEEQRVAEEYAKAQAEAINAGLLKVFSGIHHSSVLTKKDSDEMKLIADFGNGYLAKADSIPCSMYQIVKYGKAGYAWQYPLLPEDEATGDYGKYECSGYAIARFLDANNLAPAIAYDYGNPCDGGQYERMKEILGIEPRWIPDLNDSSGLLGIKTPALCSTQEGGYGYGHAFVIEQVSLEDGQIWIYYTEANRDAWGTYDGKVQRKEAHDFYASMSPQWIFENQ